jgi:hypothetical protein
LSNENDKTAGEEAPEKPKVLVKYKLEMLFGILGGVILLYTGYSGSAEFYIRLIEFLKGYFGESSPYLDTVAATFKLIASAGGLSVIGGSVLIGIAMRRIGTWLVDIGAGISLSALLIKIYLLGPVIQEAVRNLEYIKAITIFGFELGLLGAGVFLSFLATLTNYRWMLYTFLLSILSMFIGATGDPSLIDSLINKLNIPPEYGPYLYQLEQLILFIGLMYLIVMILVGGNNFWIAKSIVIIIVILMIPATISMVSSLIYLYGTLKTMEIVRITIQLVDVLGSVFFIIKAGRVVK